MPSTPPSPLALYQHSLAGDVAAYARHAFEWLRAQIDFDAGMLITSQANQPGFLDAHFSGFADVPALMASWQGVAHLDVLAPRLVAEPGVARRHDKDDPLLAGPEFAPLHAHLERFGFQHTLCLALPTPEPQFLVVIILVRSQRGRRGTDAELARLAQLGPAVAETYAACRRMALLAQPLAGLQHLCMARITRQGAYVQTTPAFCELMWAGRAPQNVHLPPEALRALSSGQAWPLPGRDLVLHAQPDAEGQGWLLRLQPRRAADQLSPREREIAQRFARGESNTAIAETLGLSPATVRNHLSNAYAKLQVRHRAGLIAALG
ncbi:helix-turn-helix transcriptional regulator [Roseateles paludis]|uniref:LuxR C-terminal-related transcriptional regulator n=1 Tax=Roseateles paludis TaxID=3145238 RepID=A0ABV0FWI0_9BURK